MPVEHQLTVSGRAQVWGVFPKGLWGGSKKVGGCFFGGGEGTASPLSRGSLNYGGAQG